MMRLLELSHWMSVCVFVYHIVLVQVVYIVQF